MFRLRLDYAGENKSSPVLNFSLEQGIKPELSPPHASQSNDAAVTLIQELW